jgi:hypothetical protein
MPAFNPEIVFNEEDLFLKQQPVRLGSKRYVLLQATQAVQAEQRSRMAAGIQVNEDGVPVGIKDLGNADGLLLSMCLYEATEDGNLALLPDGSPDPARRVPLEVISRWPDTITSRLTKALSAMDGPPKVEQRQERAKN